MFNMTIKIRPTFKTKSFHRETKVLSFCQGKGTSK
jgi:hypothetical protein